MQIAVNALTKGTDGHANSLHRFAKDSDLILRLLFVNIYTYMCDLRDFRVTNSQHKKKLKFYLIICAAKVIFL